jgi:hypothetical protein
MAFLDHLTDRDRDGHRHWMPAPVGRPTKGTAPDPARGVRPEDAHRAVWIALNGPPPPETPVVARTCTDDLCCAPSHLALRCRQATTRKLSGADVVRIQVSTLPAGQLAAMFGVSRQRIHQLRPGRF